jgi:hypothetical protein
MFNVAQMWGLLFLGWYWKSTRVMLNNFLFVKRVHWKEHFLESLEELLKRGQSAHFQAFQNILGTLVN